VIKGGFQMDSRIKFIKWIAAGMGVIAGIAMLGNYFLHRNVPLDEQPDSSPSYPNIASSTLQPMNSKDYSDLEPGSVFHDDYWHGTVTIVGKQGTIDYQKIVDGANDRLIAEQDGMVIYVEKNADFMSKIDPNAVQSGEDDTPISDEDQAFYAQSSVQLEGQSEIPAGGYSNLFPACGWSGLRYAAKQYLTDIGMEDVTTITIIPDSTQFTGSQRGFHCTMDTQEGEIGVYFDVSMGMWRFSYSGLKDGISYISYNPVDFVAPSAREAAKTELNQLVGYAKF